MNNLFRESLEKTQRQYQAYKHRQQGKVAAEINKLKLLLRRLMRGN